jgi:hypothetical protein
MIKPEDLLGAQVGRERNPTPHAQATRRHQLWERGRKSITGGLGFFLLSALSSNTSSPPEQTQSSRKAQLHHRRPRPIICRTHQKLGDSRAGYCPERTPPPPLSSETYPLPTNIKLAPLLLISLGLLCQERGVRNMCFNSFPDHIFKYICKRNPKERILFVPFFFILPDRKAREGGGRAALVDSMLARSVVAGKRKG